MLVSTATIEGAEVRTARINGINIVVQEAGPADGPCVVLCHGFPEIGYSWRHQVPALAAAGYHVLVPDQRGYGGTDRPEAIADYDITHLTDDLAGLLDEVGVASAVFVGHDWGGLVVWQMALLQRERVAGVVGVNTPYFPRPEIPPTQLFRMLGGDNHYIIWFQETGVADAVMASDVRAVFSGLMRRGTPRRDAMPASGAEHAGEGDIAPDEPRANWAQMLEQGPLPGDPLLRAAELDEYVGVFERTGFTGALNWYRNFDRNWEITPQLHEAKVLVPSLMVTAAWDAVLTPEMAAGMPQWVPDLETHLIEECGHWTPQERPDELNAILLNWLGRRFPPDTTGSVSKGRDVSASG